MKAVFKYIGYAALVSTLVSTLGCDGGDDEPAITEDDASRIAQDAVGGEPGEVERGIEGETDVWEVDVAMSNGATLEVKVDVESGDLIVVEDKTGPFDYPDFTPLPGVLAYGAITATALEEVAGTIEAWEFSRLPPGEAVEFQYEFYVRDAEEQLWEIKFDAAEGRATALEPKDMVDP